jgi:colanic acid biosynthesis glycosyl transferase WcaI
MMVNVEPTPVMSSEAEPSGIRVAFVCQWFAPEPVKQPGWIVDALVEAGADVKVLTGIPNYPTGVVTPGYRPWRRQRETWKGVPVLRTPLYPSHDASAVRRAANYLSWAVSSAILGQRCFRGVEVALVYGSPVTAAFPALVAKLRGGLPYVLYVQDLWPDSVFASGYLSRPGARWARPFLERLVSVLYSHAARIVVISPGMVDVLVGRGVPRESISLVYNWVPEPATAQAQPPLDLRRRLGIGEDDFLIMYAGNLGAAQSLDRIVDGVALVRTGRPVHLLLVGDGVKRQELTDRTDAVAPGRVHFMDAVPQDQVASLMHQADVQLVSLRDDPLFEVTLPSKLQSALASGVPVLVSARGDAARVVTESGAGVACVPGDPMSFAQAALSLSRLTKAELSAMGAGGRSHYVATMAQSVGAERLMSDLRLVADPGVEEIRLT